MRSHSTKMSDSTEFFWELAAATAKLLTSEGLAELLKPVELTAA